MKRIFKIIGHWSLGNWSLRRGFTLAELMVSVTILALLLSFGAVVVANYYGSVRNIKAANLVYEEARFAMERIAKEVRNGTIDYEEYYNQNANYSSGAGASSTYGYGENYCQYNRQFYDPGQDGDYGTDDDVNLGKRFPGADTPASTDAMPAAGKWCDAACQTARGVSPATPAWVPDPIKDNLFLIDIGGTKRTYIKKIMKADSTGVMVGRLGMVKLVGLDYGIDHVQSGGAGPDCAKDQGEGDGRIDTWKCDTSYTCVKKTLNENCTPQRQVDSVTDTAFIDITPASLDIVDLKFIISPMDDPRKAYNDPSVQIQPNVTIRMIARANKRLANEFKNGETPTVVLESTVTPRIYNPIISQCSVVECKAGTTKACPKTADICSGATQTCNASNAWTSCDRSNYDVFAGTDSDPRITAGSSLSGNPKSYYEEGTEIQSCTTDACRSRRCSDGKDNNCDGVKDTQDPSCIYFLCTNLVTDVGTGEICADVGGICDTIHPKTTENTPALCTDGIDNDCAGGTDTADTNCLSLLCNNNVHDTVGIGEGSGCVDVGGFCAPAPINHPKTATENTTALCHDGLDNDCNGKADTTGSGSFPADPNCAGK